MPWRQIIGVQRSEDGCYDLPRMYDKKNALCEMGMATEFFEYSEVSWLQFLEPPGGMLL